jgi:hypothetical protein
MATKPQKNYAGTKMRLTEALNRQTDQAAPSVNAAIFAARTNTNQGESFNLNTKQFASAVPSEGRYVVGGESDPKGKRIKTKYLNRGRKNPQMTAAEATQSMQRASLATKNAEGVHLGSWIDPDNTKKGVQIDVSRVFADKKKATDTMENRGEDAMWDLKTSQNIYNVKKKKAK